MFLKGNKNLNVIILLFIIILLYFNNYSFPNIL